MVESQAPAQNIPKGILFMLGAAVFFPLMNTGAKYLSQHYPIPEVIWARTTGQLLFMLALFLPSRGRKLFATGHLPYQLLCAGTMVGATVMFFTGVAFIPLAEAQAITFTSPLMVAILAVPLLHERVTPRHWITILVGFAGSLVVVRPGSDIANIGALLVFLNTVFYSIYQILTRILGAFDRPETTVTYMAAMGTLVLSCVVPFVWVPPQSWFHVGVFISMGVMGGLGHYCVTRAFMSGPASVISPFNYAQLLGAAGLGFWVFGAVPSVWTWVGSVIVILSGLYMVYGDAFRTRHA